MVLGQFRVKGKIKVVGSGPMLAMSLLRRVMGNYAQFVLYRVSQLMSLFMNKFFYLSSACLLNKPKTKAQTCHIYKQTNMNEQIN